MAAARVPMVVAAAGLVLSSTGTSTGTAVGSCPLSRPATALLPPVYELLP
ncbi:hypothetical protein [Nonomuraea sp. B5E05]